MSKISLNKKLEKQLFKRLKVMSYLLLFFSIASFLYAFLAPTYFSSIEKSEIIAEQMELSSTIPPLPQSSSLVQEPHQTINFYLISALFAGIGSICLIYSWRKRS